MKKTLLAAILLLTLSAAAPAQSVGSWKNYLAYSETTQAIQGGKYIYVLASGNLYSYNPSDQSIQTFDKVNYLSDTGISLITWCPQARRLIVVYQNQNIDLLNEKPDVVNVPEYYMKTMTGDKTINHVYIHDGTAYLSTGFGIVNLNVERAEIADTYNLGFNVAHCYTDESYIYAASPQQGTYRALLSANLLDKNNWQYYATYTPAATEDNSELMATVKTLNPGGPKSNAFGFMFFANNRLYTCPAGYEAAIDLYRKGEIQILQDDEWTIYEDDFSSSLPYSVTYEDVMSLDFDPRNINHVFASGRTGIYEFLDGKFQKHYTWDNSPLASAGHGNYNYVIAEGVKFDKEGNLWCTISFSDVPALACLTTSGEWKTFDKSELKYGSGNLQHLRSLMFDSRNLLWFTNNTWNDPAVICYQPSTNGISVMKKFVNQDGTTVEVSGGVYAVAEDMNGDMWIATNVGPLLLPASEIGNSNPTFTQVKVPRNDGTNYADYLLNNVDVTCLAIDGANRKWFGTKSNGVYLISADNIVEEEHFTESNSGLLSNNIESIAINPNTGEVFIGTDKGLCSYMSNASQANDTMTDDNVYAYPNPVRPDYSGPITITGLSYNADVKICTSNGVLVAEGRSNGGMFIWDGCDLKGKPVASGVYMVQTATQDGKKGTVCKVAIVR